LINDEDIDSSLQSPEKMVSSKLGKDGVSDEIRRHILDATANSDVFAAV